MSLQSILERWKIWVPLIVTLLAAFSITLVISDQDGDNRPDYISITVGEQRTPAAPPPPGEDGTTTIGDPAKPVAPPVVVDADQQIDPAERAEQHQARTEGPDTHEDSRDETPPGVPASEIAAGLTDQAAEGKGPPVPVGGAQNYSCRYQPVINQSSRGSQKVLLAVLHYTVSANRPGWGDVNAIWGLFNSRSFGASSTYIMDFEGNCLRLMAESAKPWTQGNFNGRSISIEIIATGREARADWLAAPIIRNGTLASLWRDVLRRNGLPLRHVNPEGCDVHAAGWTDHEALECGMDHTDVKPAFPYDLFQKQLTAGTDAAGPDLRVLTTGERQAATCLLAERRIAERHRGWDRIKPGHLDRATACKDQLRRANARIHQAGATSNKLNRRARHKVIHSLL